MDNGNFEKNKQQSDFLSFVVLVTISGRQENIKGYEVATKVFGRSADFDPSTDPIVRTANKLRWALAGITLHLVYMILLELIYQKVAKSYFFQISSL